ncbi:hypothetical protein [Peterkaempfera sp. SMS 1(5)a]|uniref:hypothetical protein n=1 Tax=Peterkaempfera podocarpi TaxID=3232308 RepID=UPI00366C594B
MMPSTSVPLSGAGVGVCVDRTAVDCSNRAGPGVDAGDAWVFPVSRVPPRAASAVTVTAPPIRAARALRIRCPRAAPA